MILAVALALAASQSGAAQHVNSSPPGYAFPALTGRVVDAAHILSRADEERITKRSAALERTTGHQFVVVTVRDLGGHAIEDYGITLGRWWGIGRKQVNDGVLLIIAPNERKIRIEVGYGLEKALRNDEAALILSKDVLPAFRAGNMRRGILTGVDDIIREVGPQAGAGA